MSEPTEAEKRKFEELRKVAASWLDKRFGHLGMERISMEYAAVFAAEFALETCKATFAALPPSPATDQFQESAQEVISGRKKIVVREKP